MADGGMVDGDEVRLGARFGDEPLQVAEQERRRFVRTVVLHVHVMAMGPVGEERRKGSLVCTRVDGVDDGFDAAEEEEPLGDGSLADEEVGVGRFARESEGFSFVIFCSLLIHPCQMGTSRLSI